MIPTYTFKRKPNQPLFKIQKFPKPLITNQSNLIYNHNIIGCLLHTELSALSFTSFA